MMDRQASKKTAEFPGAKRLRWLGEQIRTRGSSARKSILQRLKNPGGETRPAFLVGNVRSGTSMIVYQLAKSWQVNLFNEDHPAAFDSWRLKDFSVIDSLIEESRAPVTLFKPILDTYRTRMLMDRFPSSQLIFAFRHFDDVINSARKRFYTSGGTFEPSKIYPPRDPRNPVSRWVETHFAEFELAPPPAESMAFILDRWRPDLNLNSNIALRWLFINRLYFDLGLDQEPRVNLVSYEDIVARPEEQFGQICRFLGLVFDPRVTSGVFSSSIGRDAAPDIDPGIREDCEQLMERLLTKLNMVRQETNA